MKSPLLSRHLSRRLKYSSATFPCCVDISWILCVAKEYYLHIEMFKTLNLVILLHYNRLLVLTCVLCLLIPHYTCQRPICLALYLSAAFCQRPTCPALYLSAAAHLSRIIPVNGLLVPHHNCQRPICPALYLSAAYLSRIIPVSGLLVPYYTCQRPSCPALYMSTAYLSPIIPV